MANKVSKDYNPTSEDLTMEPILMKDEGYAKLIFYNPTHFEKLMRKGELIIGRDPTNQIFWEDIAFFKYESERSVIEGHPTRFLGKFKIHDRYSMQLNKGYKKATKHFPLDLVPGFPYSRVLARISLLFSQI